MKKKWLAICAILLALVTGIAGLSVRHDRLKRENAFEAFGNSYVADETGVWRVNTLTEPVLIYEWQTETHFLRAAPDSMHMGRYCYYLVDSNNAYRINTDTGSLITLAENLDVDWSVGERALAFEGNTVICLSNAPAVMGQFADYPAELPLRTILQISGDTSQELLAPVSTELDMFLLMNDKVYTLVVHENQLFVATARPRRSAVCSPIVPLKAKAQLVDGNIITKETDGSILIERLKLRTFVDIDKLKRVYHWSVGTHYSAEKNPELLCPYVLDLSGPRFEMLWLDDNGGLHARTLASPTLTLKTTIDETLRLGADELEQVKQYGNAVVVSLPDGTRAYVSYLDAQGEYSWLRWDLP